MKKIAKQLVVGYLACASWQAGIAPHLYAQEYAIGADFSFLKQAEDSSRVFKYGNESKPGLDIFKNHGYNWIRLRLFHTPTRLPNDLKYTIALAQAAKQRDFKFLLNYHYSDTWADPGKQFVPKAWEGRSHEQLVQAVHDYDVIGQSYYPWWHGSLLDLRENLNFMANTYQKDIILVEVAYNSEPREYRDKPAPFPETPEGQRQFLEEVNWLVLHTPNNRGKGVFWWEPATRRLGGRTMFDHDGNAMPVITVFDKYTRH
jgi:arabinogalactan endo-1,4-beta-galactosidase